MHTDLRVAGEPPWELTEREQLIRAKLSDLVAGGATPVREHGYGEHLGPRGRGEDARKAAARNAES